jgi:FHS family Na+ dependent glucose MFS transporter 1
MLCGGLILLVAVLFAVNVLQNGCSKQQAVVHDSEARAATQPLPTGLYVLVMAMMCAFYFSYYCVEETFSSLLATFVVRQLKWSKSDGAKISSVVWASSAVGRFLSIFVVRALSSAQLILVSCSSLSLSLITFLVLACYEVSVGVWVCTATGALSMGPVFATGFMWMEEELVRVTGRVVSALMVASSCGNMVNPSLTGFLLERFTPMWFCYLLVGESLTCLLVFLVLLAIARGYLAKHFQLHRDLEIEISVPEVVECTKL